ncbi:MAG: hypothetical protein H0T73_12800 [Ardenticatenales bacterium]|nr:hypothetical protein [Ardenticatenales bacterium]
MNENTAITVKELATVLKGWLVETINQELETRRQGVPKREENLGQMLRPDEADAVRKVRANRFREALAGIETMLLGHEEIEYRSVLDHVLHNIGASLQSLGLLAPEAGLIDAPQFDFRTHPTFPAMVAPRRYVALPTLTRAMAEIGLSRHWAMSATLYLAEYREWQPRFLRGPAHDDERFGLFAWNNLYHKDVCFMAMSRVPRSRPVGTTELLLLGQRTSLLGRLFDTNPRREEHIVRLSARHFTLMLRALLLDYERLHTSRQREVAEQDQLGALLWDFLSREE